MSGWAKPSSRPDNRLRPAKISAELLGRFSLRPLFPGGGTLTFHKTEALRPARTERPDCPETIGRLERVEILSSFQSYTAARAAGRTFFAAENPISSAKPEKDGVWREIASPFAMLSRFFAD